MLLLIVPVLAATAVITAEGHKGASAPQITPADVMVWQNNRRLPVTGLTPLRKDGGGLQLWIAIDDGLDTSFGNQTGDLRKFILEQPSNTQIAVGYLHNGMVQAAQKLTADHDLAAKALRLPLGMPGISASPYSALTDLIHNWPATDQAREVLMITSGIDPDYGPGPDNPYLTRAIATAQRAGVLVHSIYFGSAGHSGHSFRQINWGQNYLSQLGDETGGEFYWQGELNPVSLAPFLDELNQRLNQQYLLKFEATPPDKGSFQRIKFSTEVPHVSIVGPSHVYVPGSNGK